jgi:hypothetical protein
MTGKLKANNRKQRIRLLAARNAATMVYTDKEVRQDSQRE